MNILHLTTYYYPHIYGAENFTYHLAEYQAKNESNHVWVITGRWNTIWKTSENINRVHVIRTWVAKIRYIQTILAIIPFYVQAVRLIKQEKIDVVHAHIYPSLIVGALLKQQNQKLIITIQGGDIGDYYESFGPFRKLARKIIGLCLQKADLVHCVSTYLAREVIKMGVKKEKIIIVPNGVDINKFKIKTSVIKNDHRIKLISTSRLEEKNNLIYLIKLIYTLRQDNFAVSLDIYGTGSLEKQLQSEINIFKLQKYVNLKGYINHDQLANILPSYNYFIRLSTQEGFGISFIEAMSCGVIPIGTPIGGIPDIIIDHQNGFLVPLDGNEVKTFESIFSNQGQQTKIALAARETVIQKFNWDSILPTIMTYY